MVDREEIDILWSCSGWNGQFGRDGVSIVVELDWGSFERIEPERSGRSIIVRWFSLLGLIRAESLWVRMGVVRARVGWSEGGE